MKTIIRTRTRPIPGNTHAARVARYWEVVGRSIIQTTLAAVAGLLVKAFFVSTFSEAIEIAGAAFAMLASGLYAGYKAFTYRVRRCPHPNHPNH